MPAARIAAELSERVRTSACVVVTAPPGAGKSTLLPLTLMADGAAAGRILMLEPRRLAARQIGERMATMIGEPVGETVGYRVRFESRVSARTGIEVLTEGILTRMLVDDPTLDGVGMLIFDEFHERSLHSDLALALAREVQRLVRPDLRIVIMSATIDAADLCRRLDAALVESEGRMFPVEIVRRALTEAPTPADVVSAIREAHAAREGDILVFLPGEAEIRRCEELLGASLGPTRICPLYGLLPPERQRAAIAPSREGERKVVLATPIAETSLTIEGVRIVIDTGLCRRMVFNPQNGLSRLETVRISHDMATQRMGRAGRVAPGVCYRLWSLATEHRMEPMRRPEILEADLAPLVLDIAAWGESDPMRLPWLTPPPASAIAQANRLLLWLGAIAEGGAITPRGRQLALLPCHPRIAALLTSATTAETRALAADIAALLEEKDPFAAEQDNADINTRIHLLRRKRVAAGARSSAIESGALGRVARIAEQYRRMIRTHEDNTLPDPEATGHLIASAYPERVAMALNDGAPGRFRLAGGETAQVGPNDALAAHEWIAIASLAGSRIFLASRVGQQDLVGLATERENVAWDAKRGLIVRQREARIGRLTVASSPIADIDRERIVSTLCEAAPKEGLTMFDFSDAVQDLLRRIAAVAEWHPELGLPTLTTDTILERAEEWLPFYLDNHGSLRTTVGELRKIDMTQVVWGLLSYEQQEAVGRLAPSHIIVPTGSHIRVEYRQGAEQPILRVRLQECFGLTDTPRIDEGRRPVLMELLSPGFKPVQLTQDLRHFWAETYFEVRKELRRRYPKHAWPDNPLEAEAVRGTRKR